MNETLIPHHHTITMNENKPPSRKKALAFLISLATLPAIGDETVENSDIYTGNYQSYFHDKTESQQHNNSLVGKGNQHSTVSISSPSVTVDTATGQVASSAPVELSSEIHNNTPEPKQNIATNAPENISLLRLRQEAPPVHWNNIGRNMEAGGLHGNISTQIEIEDVRRSDSQKNSGKFKLATIQAFLRHDELPNWYFGFWNAREDSYKGQFSNQNYNGTNTINELFVGHIFETWRGNIGTEVMGGSETATKRCKNRFKVWQDLRLTNKWSLAGYAYGEYQPKSNKSGNGDLEQYIFEIEPAIQYRINPDLGLYLRPYYHHSRQGRENWGDIIEQEKK